MTFGVVIHVQTRQKGANWMSKPQFIINHESNVTLEETFHIVEKINQGFYVVEVGKPIITMTIQKDSKKEESIAIWREKPKRDQFEISSSFFKERVQGVMHWTYGDPHVKGCPKGYNIYIQTHIFK
jgi:hypothetical protein